MSRKAQESADKRRAKRPCLKKDAVASFDDLNADVLVNVLSFLERDEMDNSSVLSQRLAEARNHPSLDQTRTATIVCKSKNVFEFYHAIASKGWASDVFHASSNKKHLNMQGMESLKGLSWKYYARDLPPQKDVFLRSVTSWDASVSPNAQNRPKWGSFSFETITKILPNLQEVDLSHLGSSSGICLGSVESSGNPILRIVKMNGWDVIHEPMFPNHLTKLYLDDSRITSSYMIGDISIDDMARQDHYLWVGCRRLERLSMKNATWNLRGQEPQPISQNILIKLVRFHPTLRWLRCDLTDENLAMLKSERPEMTLLNE